MLPIGVMLLFDIPPKFEGGFGGLEGALNGFPESDVKGLVQHLNIFAKVVEFLLPHIDQARILFSS